ncbi:tRNA (32-2'-O)-methyltransferase regulator THADA [Discoglossus pictus]
MVLKKKKEIKVDALILDSSSIHTLKSYVNDKEQNLPALLLHCLQLPDGVGQIHCIKKMVPVLENLHTDSISTDMARCCLQVLAEMYFAVASKNQLKKVLASLLNSVPDECREDAMSAFTICLKTDIGTKEPKYYRTVVDNLASCLDKFSLGTSCVTSLFLEILQFLENVLRTFQSQNKKVLGDGVAQTQLMHDLLTAVKVSMTLVQKAPEPVLVTLQPDAQSALWETMCRLLSCFTNIVLDDDLLQNVQSTSGLAIVLYLKTMFRQSEKLPKLVSDLILRSVDPDDVPSWFVGCCGSLCKSLPDTAVLFLCQGALAMLEWKDGSLGLSGEKLLLDLLTVLLSLSARLKESSTAMLLSRILGMWTISAIDALHSCSTSLRENLHGHSSAMCKLLEYVYIHWEHPLDAVRHQTKLIFKNLLQIHRTAVDVSDEDVDPFLSELTRNLLNLEWHSKGKYASLACLVECVGTECILSVDQTIPAQILDVMGDQSFAPYASNLLEAMFVNHKNQLMARPGVRCWVDRWHETWVSPLLLRLCEENINQTTYIIDYYLPKLLKCNPESLSYMIDILQTSASTNVGSGNNRGALGALMACLRTARSHGLLKFTENYVWSGKVSTALIQQGLVHRHDQVRVDALGLLCESHWSTEVVSVDEMKLVQFCLTYNLNCQSPSVRQQFCYLIKKLFCRVQESSQVLYKLEQNKKLKGGSEAESVWDPSRALQQYREFMASVTERLFGSLFAGSSHPTRFSALTILGSIAEIFPVEGSCPAVFQFSRSVSSKQVQALLECFSNTFEEVKLLAFELLRKLPPSSLDLQDSHKLLSLLQAAMNLSSSTKHFDCVTASYLLNFLIYQEDLQAALSAWMLGQQGLSGGQTVRSDCGSFMERNTLAVVRALTSCLDDEIKQAEKSLLQAAASFPLYGRVHCIIGALQQLCFRDLSMVSEWRLMISELISMSYRLSAIVSPVVHSSSPEGLMPMDTDTEAAAQLHMIMNEIQPRDTNDYFSQPRILQKHCDLHSQPLPEDCVPSNTLCAEMKVKEGTSCNVTAQMVLVCCWRSMKEVSLLLGMMCQRLPLQAQPDSPSGLISVEQVKEMGEYFKHHLLQSRHRGAFELAYVGFVKLTEMLIGCDEKSLHCLPRQWLCNVLEEIKSSDPSSKLCATRRSAGIPFYIQALLASEPKNSKAGLLKMTMKELISLAMPGIDSSGNTSTIPQVHALNILRALFRDTRLGENIIPYIADGTQAAILGFTSPVWAVRNSSTLLFSTLITRIFGVKRGKDERSKKNRMTGREFFSRFPSLYPFLLSHLEIVAKTVDSDSGESKLHPSLFLLLLILSKLYPSPMDGTFSALSMGPFIPFIMRCGHSPVYRSREMAARALVPFLMVDDIPHTAMSLLKSLPESTSPDAKQNHIHGTLLQVFYLLQCFFEAKHTANSDRIQQEMSDLIINLKAKVWLAKRKNPCLVTRAAFIDILNTICSYLGRAQNQELTGFWEDIFSVIADSSLGKGSLLTPAVPGLVQYLQSASRLVLSVLTLRARPESSNLGLAEASHSLTSTTLVKSMLQSDFHEVRSLALESVLQWIQQSPGEATHLYLSSEVLQTLIEMVVKETHSECRCQVLRIHCEINTETILTTVAHHLRMEHNEFLRRIIKLASSTSESVEIQSSALKLASKLIITFITKTKETIQAELKDWVTLVVHSCEDELQADVKLAAAEILVDIAPHLLMSRLPVLDLTDTFRLWMCIFQLLQSEEPDVRDKAADIIRVYHEQKSTLSETVFPFCVVSPPMAMDLAFGVLCELIKQWDQMSAGILVLMEWLLGEDDLADLETVKLVEEDYLFEKGEANFWAEKLVYVHLLMKHLTGLMSAAPASLPSHSEVGQVLSAASARSDRIQYFLQGLPPTPEFLKTAEYTRLLIHKERTSKCMQTLALIQEKMNRDII